MSLAIAALTSCGTSSAPSEENCSKDSTKVCCDSAATAGSTVVAGVDSLATDTVKK